MNFNVVEMKSKTLFLLLVIIACIGCKHTPSQEQTDSSQPTREPVFAYGLRIDTFRIDTLTIQKGETLGGMLNRAGASAKQLTQISLLRKEQFDTKAIQVGKPYLILYPQSQQTDSVTSSVPAYFIYCPSIRESYVFDLRDSLTIKHDLKPIRVENYSAQAVIQSSLWEAFSSQNLPVELVLRLSDIYAWTIDFFGLQKGDSIRVFYEMQYVDTIPYGVGQVFAANFYNAGRWQEAFLYHAPDSLKNQYPDINGYFDGEGKSLRKAFLKAPLNYRRISSHFSYARKHPIFKTVRPHTGVDYAAPKGTPVVSIGDGVVTFKAYKGGGGNTVKIKHNATYTTAYLHLNGYAKDIQVGKRVKQGQVIGYVGATGHATGPHLDFRVWKNGTPVDPLKLQSPPATPIPEPLKKDFQQTIDDYRKHL